MHKNERDRLVNIKPFHFELKVRDWHGFELWFYSPIGDDFRRKTITKIHLDQYWVRVLAGALWKVIGKRQSEINEQKRAMELWND